MSGGIVLVTCDGPEHRYVANRICAAVPVEAILLTDQPPNRSWKTVLKKSLVEFADKAVWRTYLKLIGDARTAERDMERVFGREASAAFNQPEKVLAVGRPKAGRLRREIERLAPDYIAVYGTGMIPDSVLRQARIKAFNMHTGVSPDYRGAACAFWPIHQGEPELVGATVHECTALVDGGEIYEVARATLYRGDSLHAVFARAVKAGAEAYVRVLQAALAGRLKGEPQDLSRGREFRGHMRGMRSELRARRQLAKMNRTWPVED